MRLRFLAQAAGAAGLFLALSTSAAAQCITGGTGGLVPASGTGDGTWPGTLPTFPMVGTLNVASIPTGATVLNSLKLNGLTHTWVGDCFVTLENPAGQEFNVFHRLNFGGAGFGCDGDFGGDYEIFDPIAGGAGCGGGPAPMPCSVPIPTGAYVQNFGNWASSGGITDTPLEQIPISTGTWTVRIYDWAGGDSGALTSFDLCFGAPTVPGGGGGVWDCVTGGAGGAFPQSGAVDGTWPTVLPTGQLTSTLAVTVPAGASKITGVKLNGLSHTWLGDCQIVLSSPAGVNYNLFQEVDGNFGGGCDDSFSGNYVFVDPITGTDECGGPANTFLCSGVGSTLPPGAYGQYYGAWNSGDAGIVNVNLDAIPIASGNWTLTIYDWFVGADAGALSSWDLCFDAGPSGPAVYCTAGTSTNGCVPAISANANPSVSFANPCNITVANVEGQKSGLIYYGINNTGFSPTPWSGSSTSFLCVKGPTQRTPAQNSGGTNGSCNGSLVLDWNAYQTATPSALGNPWSVGNKAFVQGWYRDPPAPKTTNLSDALEMTYQP